MIDIAVVGWHAVDDRYAISDGHTVVLTVLSLMKFSLMIDDRQVCRIVGFFMACSCLRKWVQFVYADAFVCRRSMGERRKAVGAAISEVSVLVTVVFDAYLYTLSFLFLVVDSRPW